MRTSQRRMDARAGKVPVGAVAAVAGVAAVGLALAPAWASGATVSHWGSYIGGAKGTADTQTSPAQVAGLGEVKAIDAGNSSGYALMVDGSVWAWGNGERGQLGNGALANSPSAPVKVAFPAGTKIVSIGEAKNEAYAIDSAGQGWAWGENGSGSLCVGGKKVAAPVKVGGVSGAVAVQGGEQHVLWLLASGAVLVCGTNAQGQLGLGEGVKQAKTATQVSGLARIAHVSAGSRSSAALDASGNLYMWGDNDEGQVGVSSSAPAIWTPTRVVVPEPVTQVSAGGDLLDNGATLALTSSHLLYGWGADKHGQVGDGQTANKLSPVNTGLHFTSAVTGGAFSLGLDAEGKVWGWGSNVGGDLGLGSTGGNFFKPTFVQGGVSAISATAQNAEDIHP